MKIEILIKIDIELEDRIYDEAAELFLNHVKTHYEEKLLKGDYSRRTLQPPSLDRIADKIYHRPLAVLGKSCPVYHKNQIGSINE